MFFYISRFFAWLPLAIMYPTKIIGRKNLPKGKAILTVNHTSNMDIVLLLANLHEKKYTLAKKELFKNKFFGGILKSYGGISIDREGVDVKAIKTSLKLLSKGKKLIIFPEGTRNKGENLNKLGELKTGTAMIAIKSKTPLVPVWINRRPKIFKKTTITIGKPFELSEFYGEKLSDEVLQRATKVIVEKMEELS